MNEQPSAERRVELEANLVRVRERIRAACAAAGRTDEPTLIVVTKFHPASDIAALYDLGARAVGENREQEAAGKAAQLSEACPQLEWHFVGQLQSKKAKKVLSFASAIHSVDRRSVVAALAKARPAAAASEPVDCFVQVDLDKQLSTIAEAPAGKSRGGALPSEVLPLARGLSGNPHLNLTGVMAVAPLGEAPEPAFARLREISEQLRAEFPSATGISAGMSADFEAAIGYGATHLRVGSNVLGPRPALR